MVWSGMGFLDLGGIFSFCISVSLFLLDFLFTTYSERGGHCMLPGLFSFICLVLL